PDCAFYGVLLHGWHSTKTVARICISVINRCKFAAEPHDSSAVGTSGLAKLRARIWFRSVPRGGLDGARPMLGEVYGAGLEHAYRGLRPRRPPAPRQSRRYTDQVYDRLSTVASPLQP